MFPRVFLPICYKHQSYYYPSNALYDALLSFLQNGKLDYIHIEGNKTYILRKLPDYPRSRVYQLINKNETILLGETSHDIMNYVDIINGKLGLK